MSRLDELIQQYCPDGVEYRTLGGSNPLIKITSGEFIHQTKQSDDFAYPVYNGGTSFAGKYDKYNTEPNKVIVSARGAAGFVNYITEPFWAGNSCHVLNIIDDAVLMSRYLYFVMKSSEVYIVNKRQEGTIPSVSQKQLYDIEIPVPPLPVQEEIVRILDKFTELEQELEQELELRKKQYEYYRDKMLSFSDYDGEVEWKPLSEICPVSRGKRVVRSELAETGKIPVWQNSLTSLGYYDKANCKGGKTFIIAAGAAGEIGYCDVDFWAADDCYYFDTPDTLDDRFLYHALMNQYHRIKDKVRRGSVPRISRDNVDAIIIPVIKDVDEQIHIAKVLDKFDRLVSDISEGLPAEIKLHHQVYEYYRDKLLNFKRLEVTV